MEEERTPAHMGPQTPEGRAAVSLNRLRHGLRAAAIVIPGVEDEDDWQRFQAGVVDSFAPRGAVELELACRVAELMWRIRRVSRAERDFIVAARVRDDTVQMIESKQREVRRARAGSEPEPERPPSFYASAVTPMVVPERILPPQSHIEQVIRYEAHLSRQLVHTLHELEALQARRRGEAAPLARIDVQVSGEG